MELKIALVIIRSKSQLRLITKAIHKVSTFVAYCPHTFGWYSYQLGEEDKEAILASEQEKFGLSEGDSLLSVTA